VLKKEKRRKKEKRKKEEFIEQVTICKMNSIKIFLLAW